MRSAGIDIIFTLRSTGYVLNVLLYRAHTLAISCVFVFVTI